MKDKQVKLIVLQTIKYENEYYYPGDILKLPENIAKNFIESKIADMFDPKIDMNRVMIDFA